MKNYRVDPNAVSSSPAIKSDLDRLDRMKDEDIDYSDIPSPGDEFFTKAAHVGPITKGMFDDPEAITKIATRAFARAKDEAIRENDRLGVPSYGSKDGMIVVRQPMTDDLLYDPDYLEARLLEIVCKHCATTGDELDSDGDPVRADLMTLCAEGFYIEITGQFGPRLIAKLLPEGRTLLDQLRAQRERDRARAIDWSQCPDAESVPGRCSGAWVVKGTRLMVQAILDNAEAGCSPEEIATEIFAGITVDVVRRILAFARRQP